MSIYPASKASIALLLAKKVSVSKEYTDFLEVFSKESAVMLLERLDINKHAIDLELGREPFYEPIYSLSLVELESLKIYIKINLANGFI